MKIINIALRREDGKVETDTVYSEQMLSHENVKDIAEKFNCDVIVSYIADCVYLTEEEIRENTIVYEIEQKEFNENATTESQFPVFIEETGN